ncbi:L-arabinonolactonase [Microdochium nivale]|nr:L-arabinonolactonase [Microdochium nivale]
MASSTSSLQEWTVTEPYLNLHCGLGEGPFYEAASNTLRFVDIKKKRLHAVDLAKGPGSVTTLQLDTRCTVTADIKGVDPADKILIGAKYGIAVLDRRTGGYEYVSRFAAADGVDNERLRSNDGAADPHGRFWLGTMTDFDLGEFQPEGSVYLFADRAAPVVKKTPVTIPNSVGWSPDGKTMYLTHSSARTVFAYDYSSSAEGAISNERVFYTHDGPGEPDGFRVDVEGNIWHAVYGESRVLRLSPRGELTGQINLPTRNITCTQFVGTQLYMTSAGMEDGEGTPAEVENSGAVFRVDVGVRGLDLFEFKLDA